MKRIFFVGILFPILLVLVTGVCTATKINFKCTKSVTKHLDRWVYIKGRVNYKDAQGKDKYLKSEETTGTKSRGVTIPDGVKIVNISVSVRAYHVGTTRKMTYYCPELIKNLDQIKKGEAVVTCHLKNKNKNAICSLKYNTKILDSDEANQTKCVW